MAKARVQHEAAVGVAEHGNSAVLVTVTLRTALIDRVIHHADVLAIEGESYRRREAEKRAGKNAEAPRRT